MMGIKEALMEFASHLVKKLLLPVLLNWTCRPHKTCLMNLPKGEMVFQHSCFIKDSTRHSLLGKIEKKVTGKLPIFLKLSLTFPASWKGQLVLWACRLKINAPMVQKNFGSLSRRWDVSVNSRVLKLLKMYFLFT